MDSIISFLFASPKKSSKNKKTKKPKKINVSETNQIDSTSMGKEEILLPQPTDSNVVRNQTILLTKEKEEEEETMEIKYRNLMKENESIKLSYENLQQEWNELKQIKDQLDLDNKKYQDTIITLQQNQFILGNQLQLIQQNSSNQILQLQQQMNQLRQSYETSQLTQTTQLQGIYTKLMQAEENEKQLKHQMESLQAEKIGLQVMISRLEKMTSTVSSSSKGVR